MTALRREDSGGFSLIETMVVIAIIAVMAAVAYGALSRSRPRATFDGVTAEVQSLLAAARQQALAAGIPVAVLVFPDFVTNVGTGRLIVVQDDTLPANSLFNATATLNFGNYVPSVFASPPGGQYVTYLDLPSGVVLGPATGLATALTFPYSQITTNVPCSFCSITTPRRGAIVFDNHGRARFYSAATTTSGDTAGASFSLYAPDLANSPTSTFVITNATGLVKTFHNG